MNRLLNYFRPIYFIFFFGFAFVWRSYLVWRTTGVNHYKLGSTESAHDYMGVLFRIVLAACLLVVIRKDDLPYSWKTVSGQQVGGKHGEKFAHKTW